MKVLLLLGLVCLVAAEDYEVKIVERGMLLNEHVRFLGDDLQIFKVPKHHELQHVTVLYDFGTNKSMTVFHDLNKCRLARLPSTVPHPRQQRPGLQGSKGYIHFAGIAKELALLNLEEQVPITDMSELRPEFIEYCQGLPIYRSRTIEGHGVKNADNFLVPDPEGALQHRAKRQAFFCDIDKFFQKCYKGTPNGDACLYVAMCTDIDASDENHPCLQHLRDVNVRCVPCCQDDGVPDDAFIKNCANIHFNNEINCQRTQETKCSRNPINKKCYRAFAMKCGDETTGSIEACGDWEC